MRGLELQARLIVEGYLSGMHKSPYHGFSVEFAQHREYVPGDDIKHVDWKVYGRTGRFYLKQYEEETNLVCWLLLDISESMQYGSRPGARKYDYACMAAAALAYLILHQQDSVGLVTFDNQVRQFLQAVEPAVAPEGDGPGHEPGRRAGRRRSWRRSSTTWPSASIAARSLVVVLSDLFDDVPDILAGLKHLRHKRHEVVGAARAGRGRAGVSVSRKRRCSAAWSSTPNC